MNRALCNTGIFKTRGIFRTLINIYYGEFYSEPRVTPAYLKPRYIQNSRHTHNTVEHLPWNILFKTLMMNCFRDMVDRRKAFSRDHCQRSWPSRISDTPRAGLNLRRTWVQNQLNEVVQWWQPLHYGVTTTPCVALTYLVP